MATESAKRMSPRRLKLVLLLLILGASALAMLAWTQVWVHAEVGLPDAGTQVLQIDGAIAAVCASGDGTGFLRITLTSGSGPLASRRGEGASTMIVAIRPGSLRTEPTAAFLVPWTRNERGALAGVKSPSYGDNVVALRYAERLGGSEAIFANTEGLLCEGTGSNIFFGLGGTLFTPSLSSGCLAGVTRELLLEAGVGTEEDFHIDDLESATEIFLASTSREVQPLAAFDGRALPRAPGPLTAAARRVWLEQIANHLDP